MKHTFLFWVGWLLFCAVMVGDTFLKKLSDLESIQAILVCIVFLIGAIYNKIKE